jgi:hypothetical protein
VGQVYDGDDGFEHLCCPSGEQVFGSAVTEMTQYSSLVFAGIMENEASIEYGIAVTIRAFALVTWWVSWIGAEKTCPPHPSMLKNKSYIELFINI